MIDNFIAYWGATYIRELMVALKRPEFLLVSDKLKKIEVMYKNVFEIIDSLRNEI